MEDRVKHVAVIGAGVSGLMALHHLIQSKNKFNVTAFERNYDIGGLWLYTDQTTPDQFGLPVYSAMYQNLRTNLPTQLMTIPGFEFDDHVPNFPDRHDVLQYLQTICKKNELRKYIKFNTIVKKVIQKEPNNRETKWSVSYSDVRRKDGSTTEEYDFVVVCNGACVSPRIPEIPGSENFKGFITHSINYKRPNIYAGQTVAILGGSFSALDLSLQLTDYARKVFICYRKKMISTQFPSNVIEKIGTFTRFMDNSVVLDTGEELTVDSIIYCTGYSKYYPFLPKGIIKIEDRSVRNLYKEIIPYQYSSIMIISTEFFLRADVQARFIKAVLDGTVKLPNQDRIKRIGDDDFYNRISRSGRDHITILKRISQTWDIIDELAEIGGFDPLPNVLRYIHLKTIENLVTDFSTFKNFVFKITSKDTFEMTYIHPKKTMSDRDTNSV